MNIGGVAALWALNNSPSQFYQLVQYHCPNVESPAPKRKAPAAKIPHIAPTVAVMLPEAIKAPMINRTTPPIISRMGDIRWQSLRKLLYLLQQLVIKLDIILSFVKVGNYLQI